MHKQHGIPRILHHVWIDFGQPEVDAGIAGRFAESVSTCVDLHRGRGWMTRTWAYSDVIRLLERDYAWFLETFKALPRPVMMTDAARFAILHAHGGVYVDTDVWCLRALDDGDLLDGADVLLAPSGGPRRVSGGVPSNYVMAARPGSPFMLACLRRVAPSAGVYGAAGPLLIASVLAGWDDSVERVRISRELNACGWCGQQGGCARKHLLLAAQGKSRHYCAHEFASTWHGASDAIASRSFCAVSRLANPASAALVVALTALILLAILAYISVLALAALRRR